MERDLTFEFDFGYISPPVCLFVCFAHQIAKIGGDCFICIALF